MLFQLILTIYTYIDKYILYFTIAFLEGFRLKIYIDIIYYNISTYIYIARGDMWQHWEVGRDIFHKYLLDGDYALNSANWMWLSASAFFSAYFRVYSPISFGKKTDSNGNFIRKWVPLLKNYDKKYIYEPWKAPIKDQRKWGCIIGKDYPKPMLNHDDCKTRNMAKMKAAFQKNRNNNQNNKNNSSKKRNITQYFNNNNNIYKIKNKKRRTQ